MGTFGRCLGTTMKKLTLLNRQLNWKDEEVEIQLQKAVLTGWS